MQSIAAYLAEDITELVIQPESGSYWQGPTSEALAGLLHNISFKRLRCLELIGCGKLTSLPGAITTLEHLTTLVICSCTALEHLPPNMDKLINLKELAVTACSGLHDLPHNLTDYSRSHLSRINLRGCGSLQALPPCIGHLPMLKTLDLSYCPSLAQLPETLKNCMSLTSVLFAGCDMLESMAGQDLLRKAADGGQETPAILRAIIHNLNQRRSIFKLAQEQERMLETLERMSWIAVLLATATFIGFLQPPHGALADSKLSETNSTVDTAVMAFFVLDTWSFLLSFSSLVIIVVLSMPRLPSQSPESEAGRFWLLLYLAWGQLYGAVGAGCGAFVASAFAVYDAHTRSIWIPTCWGGFVLFGGACIIFQRFRNLNPGMKSIVLGLAEIWQRDLPFHRLIPCNGLMQCIACQCIVDAQQHNTAPQQGVPPVVDAVVQDDDADLHSCWLVDCLTIWRTYLWEHGCLRDTRRYQHSHPATARVVGV